MLALAAAISLVAATSVDAQPATSTAPVAAAGPHERPKTKPIVQSCFGPQNNFGCAIRADLDPKTLGGSQPASFSFTRNNAGRDYAVIQAALKLSYDLGPAFLNLKGQWHQNTQQTKEQDNQLLGIGATFSRSNVEAVYDRWVLDNTRSTDYWAINTDLDLSFNRKATFGDAKAASCITNPAFVACNKQFLESARLSVVTAPFSSNYEEETGGAADRAYWVFAPTFGAFMDSALNDDYVALNGKRANGIVAGLTASASVSVAPEVFKNQWEIVLSAQTIQAVQRDAGRIDDFQKTSNLFSASISYALGNSFLGQKGERIWIPTLTLAYANGSDSLKGRADQDTLTLGLTVKY